MEPSLTCRVHRWYVVFIALWNGVALLLVTAIVIGTLMGRGHRDPAEMVFFWFVMVGWVGWFLVYRLFFDVRLYDDDGRLAFRGLFRRLDVRVGDVEFIGRSQLDWTSWVIKTSRGSAAMPRAMTNKFDLATRLCELNPRIDLRQI